MNWNLVVLAYICATLIVGGQWAWKVALSGDLKHGSFLQAGYIAELLKSPLIWSGVILYMVATVFFMYLLREFKLGLVYPVVISMVLLNSVIVARFFLSESFTVQNGFGLALLLGSVYLLAGS